MIYSIPYIVYYLFLFLLFRIEYTSRISRSHLRVIECFAFLFFFGLRGYVHSDVSVYYYAFLGETDFFDWGLGNVTSEYVYEPGYRLLSKCVRALTNNYFVFQFVNSLIDVILLDIIFNRYTKYYALGWLVFFIIEGGMFEMNLLRNIKSILIFILSVRYIYERKMAHYIFFNVAGMMFHMSAFFYLPLYWIVNKSFPKGLIALVILLGVILPLFNIHFVDLLHLDSIIGMRYVNEIINADQSYSVGMRLFERVLVCIIILQLYDKTVGKEIRIFFNLYIIYYIMFNVMYEIPIFPMRVAALFLPSAWIVYSYILTNYHHLRQYLRYSLLFIYGTLLLISTYGVAYAEYSNVIFGTEEYGEYVDRYNRSIGN